ncbi:MAG: hypothetical protein ACD_15C00110G0004 [uncultured bacterium]|nr:MAG: hypothetical protein ACD_15C00110G0004 [uncultured bacterium]
MLETIFSQIIFFTSLMLVSFLPGYFLLLAVFGKSKAVAPLERFILSFGLSLVSVDFIFFVFSKSHRVINQLSSVIGIALFLLVCLLVYNFRNNTKDDEEVKKEEKDLFVFSKKQLALFLLLIFATIFIKIAYLSGTVFPTSTDMGHHMYWAKWMVENQALPTYDGMPDFIIGEHIIFGLIAILSGADFFSAFPIIVLLLINLAGILTVFLLVLRATKQKSIALLSLLFLGVLYAISSPQAKFVSGGVIGNIMGNLLMPMAFYFYCRAFSFFDKEKMPDKNSSTFLALAVFSTFGLFYTHHLTSFIFLFITALFLLIFFVLNFSRLKQIFSQIFKVVVSPQVIGVFTLGLIFFLFVFTPTYMQNNAVDTAVGAPSKETRAGLTIANLRDSVGESRIAFGFVGIVLIAWATRRKNFENILFLSWVIMIFIMSAFPHLLFINLPSSRIGNYLSYPLAILSGYSVYFFFTFSKEKKTNPLITASFIILLTFVFVDGMKDSAQAFKKNEDLSPIAQTFNASSYLKKNIAKNDIVLKDHNYITADSWIKLFLMQGYKYPLSRGYFKRYDDTTKPREMCTLRMIASPSGQDARTCFAETGTNFIMINPAYDSAQFKKISEFDLVYSASKINTYYRK